MPKLVPPQAECLVFTFKEGLLSSVAHDLKLRVNRFWVEVGLQKAIEAGFDASSLEVVCAMRGRAEDHDALSEANKFEILDTIQNEILDIGKHPEITFLSDSVDSAGQGYSIKGTLSINGRQRKIEFTTSAEGRKQVAEIMLNQTDFGIKPFKAMFGTLKIKPEVKIRIELPA